MGKFNIEEKEVKKVTYTTSDGEEFDNMDSTYLHNCYMFMYDILDNHTYIFEINDEIFEYDTVECYKLQNREELDMFLYAYLDYYTVNNEKEIIDKAETRKEFPCTLCCVGDMTLLFKEDLIGELENVINKLKEC